MIEEIPDDEQPKILIVDDEQDARILIRKELKSLCYHVSEVSSGEAALDFLSGHKIDLVLLDVVMHGLNGIETCRAIRAKPKCRDLPVLMLTGVEGIEFVREAFDAGATDFITKSSRFDLISQRIRYALRNSKQTIAISDSRQQLIQAQQVAKLGYWKLDIAEQEMTLSDVAVMIFGLPPEANDFTLKMYLDFVHVNDREEVRTAIERAIYDKCPFNMDHRIVRTDSKECYLHAQGEVIYDQGKLPISMFGTIQDITVRKRAEVTNEHLALYDSLTDLCNRRLFQNRLAHSMNEAHKEEKLLAVCFFDLDNFKAINDSLGHAVGDELLKSVAKRLRSTMRQGDLVARISGDEFALAVEGLRNVEELDKIVEKVRKRLSEPYGIRGHKILATASIGVALYPLDSANRATMMSYADAAMYRAKERGGNCYCYYTYDMNDKSRRRLDMEIQLGDALAKNELQVFYQPQIDVKTRKIIGLEALLRWQHPAYGLLAPSKFMSIAEESGSIYAIGEWVIETACRQIVDWKNQGHGNLRISVNLSKRQLAQDNIVDRLQTIITQTRIDPHNLIVEICESVAMQNNINTNGVLHNIKALGAGITIDDFGSGQSSMNQLQHLPVDAINIDRSFIMNIAGRDRDGATAKAIIALGKSMGLRVIAEGVETDMQREFLAKYDCDEMQGNLFSPPIAPEQIPSLLQSIPAELGINP